MGLYNLVKLKHSLVNAVNIDPAVLEIKKLQDIWSDNAVSVTAYYKESELTALKDWLNSAIDRMPSIQKDCCVSAPRIKQ